MKSKYSPILFIGLALLLLSFTVGCGKTEITTPKVYEVTMDGTKNEIAEDQTLNFQCKIGDRVEGQVTTTSNYVFLSSVVDPYGSMVCSSYINREPARNIWQFAFFAATNGEYVLKLSSDYHTNTLPSANIKITVYGE